MNNINTGLDDLFLVKTRKPNETGKTLPGNAAFYLVSQVLEKLGQTISPGQHQKPGLSKLTNVQLKANLRN